MDLDDIFAQSFLNDLAEKENKKIQTSQEDRIITKEKQKKLKVIEEFLQKFVDLGVCVNHSDQYTKNTTTMSGITPQKFSFYYIDSSKPFYPGVSIWFDHPATVEIAIPNDEERDGLVVIKVASYHDFSYLLESKFTSYESACEALGRFIARCTTSMEKDPRKHLKDLDDKKKLNYKNKKIDTPSSLTHQEKHETHLENSNKKDIAPKGLKKIGELLKIRKDTDNPNE